MNPDSSKPPLPTSLEGKLDSQLKRRQRSSKLRSLKSSRPGSVDFSSNDFLSLATTKEFRQDYLRELENQILPVGSTGSRLLDGNSEYAENLEREIAHFHGAQSGLLVGSGFDGNVSIFTCLPQPGDIILHDELIHASVHDGMRMSRAASVLSFKHNCLNDFRDKLNSCVSSHPRRDVFVAVESVYSMDGDLAPMAEMVVIMKEIFPDGNCHLVVDEAHATGVYGPKGSGRVNELGLEKDVLVRLNTFGKAMASNGAIILCSPTIRSYLINYARPLIFTTFMSYPTLVAIKVAYDWLKSGKTEKLAARLKHLIHYLDTRMRTLTYLTDRLPDGYMVLPETCPESAIFALMMREPRELAAFCQSAGFVARAVMHPTVPLGTERVRICLHSGNTEAEIDAFVEVVRSWLEDQVPRDNEFSSLVSAEVVGASKARSGPYQTLPTILSSKL